MRFLSETVYCCDFVKLFQVKEKNKHFLGWKKECNFSIPLTFFLYHVIEFLKRFFLTIILYQTLESMKIVYNSRSNTSKYIALVQPRVEPRAANIYGTQAAKPYIFQMVWIWHQIWSQIQLFALFVHPYFPVDTLAQNNWWNPSVSMLHIILLCIVGDCSHFPSDKLQ